MELEAKLFDRYELDDITIPDPGMGNYINLEPTIVPHSGGKHANKPFGKQDVSVFERLINSMMRSEDWTGKKSSAYKAVKDAFEIIEERTQDNPVQVFVEAVVNSGPREETTRLRYGGISVPKAVDTGPARRVDFALRHLATGAVAASHKSANRISVCLAEEIMNAANGDARSYAVNKKEETERVAKSAR